MKKVRALGLTMFFLIVTVFLMGSPAQGTLIVDWRDNSAYGDFGDFHLSADADESGIFITDWEVTYNWDSLFFSFDGAGAWGSSIDTYLDEELGTFYQSYYISGPPRPLPHGLGNLWLNYEGDAYGETSVTAAGTIWISNNSVSEAIAFNMSELVCAATPVPEPSTMLLIGTGLVGLLGFGRKKLSQK